MNSSDLISVARFRTRADAQKAKRILDVAGIESALESDPTVIYWGPTQGKHFAESNATQLMVSPEDLDRAGEALRSDHHCHLALRS